MKRALVVCWLLAALVTSCAATLRVNGTAPAQDNDGTCSAPSLIPRSGDLVVHFLWTGPSAGHDSITVASGSAFQYLRPGLPEGVYTVRVWASDPGGPGCDTTVTRAISSPPWKVQM